jgi:hypothetical protein
VWPRDQLTALPTVARLPLVEVIAGDDLGMLDDQGGLGRLPKRRAVNARSLRRAATRAAARRQAGADRRTPLLSCSGSLATHPACLHDLC